MARFGRMEQIVIAAAAVTLVVYVLGIVIEGWSLSISAGSILLGSLIALAVTFSGAKPVAGLSGGTLIRIGAALVGAFALIDFGDLLASVSQWTTLTIAFTILYVAGAIALAYGAWAVSGGSLAAELTGIARVTRLPLADMLIYLGALGVIVSWFLMMWVADIFNFTVVPQLSVLSALLVLIVRWLDRNPSAGRLPVPAVWTTVVLAGASVIAGAVWVLRGLSEPDTFEIGGITAIVPILVYIAALVALGFGAFRAIGATGVLSQPATAAAPAGGATPPPPATAPSGASEDEPIG